MARISPFLWFNAEAEDAARHYTSIFPNSRIVEIQRYGEAGPGAAGSVMLVSFELEGREFVALNGGPEFTFTEAISFYTTCATQAEVDELWSRLAEGGEEGQCGWLKDRYGVSWQIVPEALTEMLSDADPVRSQAVIQALMTMGKIEIQELRDAYEAAAAGV
jgi:predicted 3-demethylubiquinone-9 3-methyltransferase (glyoxalase superfamily)